MNAKSVVTWVLCILLGVFFLFSAYPKLSQNPETVSFFEMLGFGTGFVLLIGVLEALGGILVLLPRFATWGAAIIAVVMFGAIWSHLSSGVGSSMMAIASLVVALIVGCLRKPEALFLSDFGKR